MSNKTIPSNAGVCESCGHWGYPKSAVKGHLAMEVFLWLLLIIPGFIYTLWRITSDRLKSCPHCAGKMVPAASPRGRQLLDQFHPGLSPDGAVKTQWFTGHWWESPAVWMMALAMAVFIILGIQK